MVWLKTFKLSALRRQPEDVEYCYYVSILADAMIQVWGCLATSPLRYQRIQEMFMFLFGYYSCIITNTTDLQIRSCLFLIVCTFVYIHVFVHGCEGLVVFLIIRIKKEIKKI
ncbi:hypothetical protein HanPSC8_Chr10g0441381 [Helianthus annuus]|nr:hypothetical protein HanPSC8_Chr10g0441381 [Helianthus annuus]